MEMIIYRTSKEAVGCFFKNQINFTRLDKYCYKEPSLTGKEWNDFAKSQ